MVTDSDKHLISDEKDLGKLKLSEVKQCIAIPVLDKKQGSSQAVIQVYNVDQGFFESAKLRMDQKLLWDISSLISNVLFNFESLQGMLANNDVLEAQFNLVNDGVIMINAD